MKLNDLLTEEQVISALISQPNLHPLLPAGMGSTVFYSESTKLIYEAMETLLSINQSPDLNALRFELKRRGTLEIVGGVSYLSKLASCAIEGILGLKDNSLHLVDLSQRRRATEVLMSTITALQNTSSNKDMLLDDCLRSLNCVTESKTDSLVHISEAMSSAYEQLEFQADGKGSLLSSGSKALDERIGGFDQGELIVIAGRPGMAKTATMMSLAQSFCEKGAVLIFSLEMSKEQLSKRIFSDKGNIDSSLFRSAGLRDKDWVSMAQIASDMSSKEMFVDDRPGLSVSEIVNTCRRWALINGKKPAAVMIDYLGLMEGCVDGSSDSVAGISKTTSTLRNQLAKAVGCPVFLLAQLNRSLETRNDKRPMLSDLRGSGGIEQDADMVIFLYRDEVYNPDTTDMGKIEFIIRKFRDGPVGTVTRLFHKGRIMDM
jgi:replicative DNA helicase